MAIGGIPPRQKVVHVTLILLLVVVENGGLPRHFYNHERPHGSLGNKTPTQVSGTSHVV